MSLRAVFGALSALLILAGCGTAHPGAAAVVSGQEITLSEVDEIAGQLCDASGAQADEQQAAEREQAEAAGVELGESESQVQRQRQGELRVNVVETLIRQVALEQIIAEEEIEIAYDEYRVPPDTAEVFEEIYDDPETITTFAESFDYNNVASERLAQLWGFTAEELQTQEGVDAFLQQIADRVDLTVDPRFGIEDDFTRSGSRSVSVLASGDEDAGQGGGSRREVTVGRLC